MAVKHWLNGRPFTDPQFFNTLGAKYWANGLPFAQFNADTTSGGFAFWLNGLPWSDVQLQATGGFKFWQSGLPLVRQGLSDITLAPGAGSIVYTGGTPVLSFSGTITLTPGAGTITYTGGPVVLDPAPLTAAPGPATITYTGGTPTIALTIDLAPGPGRIVYQPRAPGVSLVRTSASGTQLYIGGVSYGTWKQNTFRRDENIDAAYSAGVQLDYTGTPKPALSADVAMFVDGVKRFGGYVKARSESAVPGQPFRSVLSLEFSGYGSLLDRTVDAKLYTLPIGGVVSIITYGLWYDHLRSEGVSYNHGPDPGVLIRPILFHYKTLRQCFREILDQAPGWSIWIDNNKELRLADTDGAGDAAPFDLSRTGVDPTLWDPEQSADNITVRDSDEGFRNREYYLPSSDLLSMRTETAVGDGSTIAFITVYALNTKPVVVVDGVALAVDELSSLTGAPVYYIDGGIGIFFHVAPAAAAAISITYPSPWQLAMIAEDLASIAAIGPYEHVTQGLDVTDEPTAQQLAQARLDLYGPGGDRPQLIDYGYNSRQQDGWLEPGMLQAVDWTFPDVSGNLTVRRVSSEEYGFRLWRHRVTLGKGPTDVTGVTDRDALLQLALRRSNVNVPHVATMEVVVDTDLTTGVQINFIRLKGNGVLASWDAADPSNPGGSAWLIDLRINGTTVFPAGAANQINIADGITAEQGGFRFATDNLPYSDGDVLTMDIISAAPLAPRRMLLVHLNLKPTLAAGE